MIFYEAPHKLRATLEDLHAAFGDRPVALCRELTKLHEEVRRTTLAQAEAYYREVEPRGEFVLVVAGGPEPASPELSLEEAVEKERELLLPVKQRADFVINTTRLSTAKLRSELLRIFNGEGEQAGMTVSVTSFGFKYGLPLEADLVLDVRFMPNPFYIEELRHQTGLDKPVSDYVFSFQQTHDFLRKVEDLLGFTLPLYAEEGKTGLVIAVGCTGGHHRSVAIAHALTEFIRRQGYQASEHHRDMERAV